MSFLAPWALGIVAFAALPVALHLFRRDTKRRLAFPAIRYLRQARERSARALKLRDRLLLLTRACLVAVLAAAASATCGRPGRRRGPRADGPGPAHRQHGQHEPDRGGHDASRASDSPAPAPCSTPLDRATGSGFCQRQGRSWRPGSRPGSPPTPLAGSKRRMPRRASERGFERRCGCSRQGPPVRGKSWFCPISRLPRSQTRGSRYRRVCDSWPPASRPAPRTGRCSISSSTPPSRVETELFSRSSHRPGPAPTPSKCDSASTRPRPRSLASRRGAPLSFDSPIPASESMRFRWKSHPPVFDPMTAGRSCSGRSPPRSSGTRALRTATSRLHSRPWSGPGGCDCGKRKERPPPGSWKAFRPRGPPRATTCRGSSLHPPTLTFWHGSTRHSTASEYRGGSISWM